MLHPTDNTTGVDGKEMFVARRPWIGQQEGRTVYNIQHRAWTLNATKELFLVMDRGTS